MAITIEEIVIEVNDNLQTAFTSAQVRPKLQMILDDLSEIDLLVAVDDTQTLVDGTLTINEPTLYREMVAMTLTQTASGLQQEPLLRLRRGHEQYRSLKQNDTAKGTPWQYSQFNGKFYLWRVPNEAFSVKIEYYKNHAQLVADAEVIEFGDMFRNTIYAGVSYKMALGKGRLKYVNTWLPVYEDAKEKRNNATYRQPRFVRG